MTLVCGELTRGQHLLLAELEMKAFYFLTCLVYLGENSRYPEWDKWSGIERHGNHDVNYTESKLAGWVSRNIRWYLLDSLITRHQLKMFWIQLPGLLKIF